MGYGFGKYSFLEGEERLRIYRETASHGDLTSMKELAYILKNEYGGLQELQESFQWYLRAATFNDYEAILNVGDMLRDGVGTEKNPVAAIEYYKKVVNAPRAHHTERKSAANKIAYTYEKCLNDDKKAVKWLQKSSRQGNLDARLKIAEIYRDSRGSEPDKEKAIKYFTKILNDKSLSENEKSAVAFEIDNMFRKGIDVEQSDLETRLKIAEIYRDGQGLKSDGEKAIECFTKILNDKSLPEKERFAAAFEIAKMFRKGIAVEQSDEKSIKFFKLATKSHVSIARTACNELVKIYCSSEEVTPNVGMAIYWLRKSAELGSKKATFTLAKIFRDGADGVNQNGEKALEILEKVAQDNFDTINKVTAMRIIAEMYAKGIAVAEDKEKAERLYQESSRISSEWTRALNNLQNLHPQEYYYEYTHLSPGIQIDKYIGNETYVDIPTEIEGQPVTHIGYRAFDNANLKKISIPANVKTIVYGAVISQYPLKIYFKGTQIQMMPQSFIAPEIEIYFDKRKLLETLKNLENTNPNVTIHYESAF